MWEFIAIILFAVGLPSAVTVIRVTVGPNLAKIQAALSGHGTASLEATHQPEQN